jgi:WD40 repeat protein
MSSYYGRSTSAPSAAASTVNLTKDVTLSSPPDDSISDLSWSPFANHLAVASWDSKVRIYDVTQNSAGIGKAVINFEGPVLSCAWSKVRRSLHPVEYADGRFNRTAHRLQVLVQTKQLDFSISAQMVLHHSKSPPTMPLFDPSDSSSSRTRTLP